MIFRSKLSEGDAMCIYLIFELSVEIDFFFFQKQVVCVMCIGHGAVCHCLCMYCLQFCSLCVCVWITRSAPTRLYMYNNAQK